MKRLSGKVALVTGASRGIGKGVALELGEAGAIVYVTGRTIEEGKGVEGLPGSITETQNQIIRSGGTGIAVRCDHRNDRDVEHLFAKIRKEQGKLDLLANCAWGGYEMMFGSGNEYRWEKPFWMQPISMWDTMFASGVRAAYVASHFAAMMMVARKSGLIVNLSFWAAQRYMGNVAYGVSKAATDRLTEDMAHDLKGYNVAVVSLYPGLVRTERVMRASQYMDLSDSESPQFVGRAVCALMSDEEILTKTGNVLTTSDLAKEYGFTDIDGKLPEMLVFDDQ